jgi:hypothetical protein
MFSIPKLWIKWPSRGVVGTIIFAKKHQLIDLEQIAPTHFIL